MSKLGKAMREAPLPERPGAVDRAVAAVLAEADSQARRPPSQGRLPRRRMAVAAAALLMAIAAGLTPPVQGLAKELGELVGIGGEPTLKSQAGQNAVVIGSGEAARSYPYEIVASVDRVNLKTLTERFGPRYARAFINRFGPSVSTCVSVQFPTVRRSGFIPTKCLQGDQGDQADEAAGWPIAYAAPEEFEPEGELVLAAIIPVGSTPAISYPTSSGDGPHKATVRVGEITDKLGKRIRSAERFRYFFALLPKGVLEGSRGNPSALTVRSIARSLRRIRYTLTAPDGSVLIDRSVAALGLGPLRGARLLWDHPPAGFALAPCRSPRPSPAARRACARREAALPK